MGTILSFVFGGIGKFISGFSTYIMIALAVACGIFYWLYHGAEAGRVEAVAAFQAEKLSHEVTKKSFDSYRTAAENSRKVSQASLDQLSKDYIAERKKANELSEKLAEHDFGHLSFVKPGLVTGIINRGTRKLLDSIRDATGGSSSPANPKPSVPAS